MNLFSRNVLLRPKAKLVVVGIIFQLFEIIGYSLVVISCSKALE